MKKTVRILALALVTVFLFSGCELFGVQKKPVERGEIPQTEFSGEPTSRLVVWGNSTVCSLAYRFNALHPELEVTAYDPAVLFGDRILPKTLADGTGGYEYPDVIQLTGAPYTAWGQADGFEDVYKLMDAGTFLDLSPLMERDLDKDDYSEAALRGCLYRGGQYLCPLYLDSNFTTLFGDRAALTERGFDFEALKSAPALLTELARVRGQGPETLRSALSQLADLDLKQLVFAAAAPQLVDYEEGTALTDGEAFKSFSEAWKKFFYEDGGEAENGWEAKEQLTKLMDGECLFELNYELKCALASGLKETGEPLVRGFPNTEGGATGELTAVGLCAKGENHQNAWAFVRYLLSEEIQGESGENLPVLLTAREQLVEAKLRENEQLEEPYRLNEEERQAFRDAAGGVTQARVSSPELYRLFETHMEPWLAGSGNYGDCVKALTEALREYLAA